jgi:hypothetical protein
LIAHNLGRVKAEFGARRCGTRAPLGARRRRFSCHEYFIYAHHRR